MVDDILPVKTSWLKRYFASLGKGLTPEVAADATKKSGRTFIQSAIPVVVAAGTGFVVLDVWQAAALAGGAAVLAFWQNALGK